LPSESSFRYLTTSPFTSLRSLEDSLEKRRCSIHKNHEKRTTSSSSPCKLLQLFTHNEKANPPKYQSSIQIEQISKPDRAMKDMRMVYEQEDERVALCKRANEQHSLISSKGDKDLSSLGLLPGGIACSAVIHRSGLISVQPA